MFADEDSVEKIAQFVKAYIAMGGHQLQLNTVNREQMLDAQKHPEKYPNLRVRVSGFSALYVTLSREVQEDILRRTQQG